jgi:hypothetical protein
MDELFDILMRDKTWNNDHAPFPEERLDLVATGQGLANHARHLHGGIVMGFLSKI